MIILFLVDTSGSMLARPAGSAVTLLDLAKGAVAQLVRLRCRDGKAAGDRFLLATFADVRVGWRAGPNVDFLLDELAALTATDLSTPAAALHAALAHLNLFRLPSGIENHGFGRIPWFIEPAAIVVLTDGGAGGGKSSDPLLRPLGKPESDAALALEAFRWDQRLFTFLLRMPGTGSGQGAPAPLETAWATACDSTGGKMIAVASPKALTAAIDLLHTRLAPSVVVALEPQPLRRPPVKGEVLLPPSPRQVLRVRPGPNGALGGHWPIPEAFVPGAVEQLPARAAHPVLSVAAEPSEALNFDGLPVDIYELDGHSPLTQYMVGRARTDVCWRVYVAGCLPTEDLTRPFGFIRLNADGKAASLHVLPFDYVSLAPLLHAFPKSVPSKGWLQQFEKYMLSVPPYYYQALRAALTKKYGQAGSNLVPERFEAHLKFAATEKLKKLIAEAKIEADRVVLGSDLNAAAPEATTAAVGDQVKSPLPAAKTSAIPPSVAASVRAQSLRTQTRDIHTVPRAELIQEWHRLKENLQRVVAKGKILPNENFLHTASIANMGNYTGYVAAIEPFRSPVDDVARGISFGNPYRLTLSQQPQKQLAVDEADDVAPDAGSTARSMRPASPKLSHALQSSSAQPDLADNASGPKAAKIRRRSSLSPSPTS